MLPAIIAAGAALAGGLNANAASAKQAKDEQDFQERMSGTAHQREVADLEAAGLNPILSANSGASTPVGAMAPQQNVLSPAVGSALDTIKTQQQQKQLELNNLKNIADVQLTNAQKKNVDMDTIVKSKGVPEADLKNQAYDAIKPMIRGLREMFNSNANPVLTPKSPNGLDKIPQNIIPMKGF